MNLNRIVIVAAGLIIVSLLTWWAFDSLEFAEIERDFEASLAARQDPWLAIERNLSPEPGTVRYKDAEEIDLIHASVVALDSWDLPALDTDELIDWVETGGRLILIFNYEMEEERTELPEHPLFNDLYPDYPEQYVNDTDNVTDNLARSAESFSSLPVNITVDMGVNFTTAHEDAATGVYFAGNDRKAVVRAYGEGVLFAAGLPLALHNDGIKFPGNRELAGFLFDRNYRPGLKVWLPARSQYNDAYVKRLNGGPILLSAALVCIMLFWMGGPRLGSIIPDEVRHRRSLRERFTAEGHFLWQHKAGNYMLGNPDEHTKLSKQAFIDAVNHRVNLNSNSK
jgi:hypothetical protein